MKRIYLIGYMGSGKTTVGQLLARKLNFSFIDLDSYIENRTFKKISEIFAEQGETGFREIEHKMLREVSEMENVIISTGGGAACFLNNMDLMNSAGETIYLHLSVDGLVKRLENAKQNRPLIKDKTSEELADFIQSMLQTREKYYTQAKYIIQNENKSAEEVVSEIIRIFND
jgi:shikimate kinase